MPQHYHKNYRIFLPFLPKTAFGRFGRDCQIPAGMLKSSANAKIAEVSMSSESLSLSFRGLPVHFSIVRPRPICGTGCCFCAPRC